MSSVYDQLLDATIRHLEDLKTRGIRYVPVTTETLTSLAKPATVTAPSPTVPQPKPAQLLATARSGPVEAALPLAPSEVTTTTQTAPTAAPLPARSSAEKSAAFEDLRRRALACVKCPNLASSRKNVVFGVGNPEAELMFVGEAPGADEDEQGEPFVGRAGELLTKIIQATGLQRRDVYIANILKCRPDTPDQTSGNRKPTPEEMKTCIPFLHEQIDLIGPKVLVALGGVALEGLVNKTGITKLRGQWLTYRGIPLMPTFHPSYLLRNQAMSEKRKVWEDMLQVMEKLSLPISEKQRNFFLRGA